MFFQIIVVIVFCMNVPFSMVSYGCQFRLGIVPFLVVSTNILIASFSNLEKNLPFKKTNMSPIYSNYKTCFRSFGHIYTNTSNFERAFLTLDYISARISEPIYTKDHNYIFVIIKLR